MPPANVSKRLRRASLIYSALVMLVVGVAVALVGVLPLARKLREAHQQNLLVDLQRQTLAVEGFLARVNRSAGFSAARVQTQSLLDAFARGEIPREGMETNAAHLLLAITSTSSNVAGIQLFDLQTNLLASAGHFIAREAWPWPDPTSRDAVINGPIRVDEEPFLVASVNVLSPQLGRTAVLHLLYRTRLLKGIMEDYTLLGRSGETIVGARQNKGLPIFFPLRESQAGRAPDPARTAAILEAIGRAVSEKRTDLFTPRPPLDDSVLLAYGPMKGAEWGLVIAMDRSELLSGINHQVTILAFVHVALIIAGTGGMVLVLGPLTGRLGLHAESLETSITEKSAALDSEVAERQRLEQLRRDSEALYQSLVDTLPINILRKDLRGRVTFGNRGYCERMGKPLGELLGKADHDLFPPELAEKYCRDDEKVVRTGEMFEDIEEHRSGDDHRLYVHVLKAPVHDASGKIVGTQVIFWDVTARRLAEEALERAAAELARSNKELEQFAYVASHDLQEPLRMITSYTQLIARRYQDRLDEDAKEFMRFAVDGALRMQKLIQGLLEYSRVGTRGKPFEAASCESALDGALANLKIVLEESGAVLHRTPLPRIMGDPIQLTQLFQNLISNALKFRGQEKPVIQIEAERKIKPDAAALNVPPYEWVFHVRDNGIGIEPQYFERIFVIFQRLHTQDQYPGTGIGLAICRKIVERHGGRIWLDSIAGRGTTFHFTLPAMD